jgi:hypothetical protein
MSGPTLDADLPDPLSKVIDGGQTCQEAGLTCSKTHGGTDRDTAISPGVTRSLLSNKDNVAVDPVASDRAATEDMVSTSYPDTNETSSEVSEVSENEEAFYSPTPQEPVSDELVCSFYPTPSSFVPSPRRKASSDP